jgi:N-acetyl-gamma-glutamyl-phosphate reductase
MLHKYAVAIVGIRGYSGLELARILLKHPHANLVAGFATDNSFNLSQYLPEETASAVPVHPVSELHSRQSGLHTVFLATPAEVSAKLAPSLVNNGIHVIDLSGAFRIHPQTLPSVVRF